MFKSKASALAHCLQAIEQGRATPADCLMRYPEHRDELGPLLETAALLRAAPQIAPCPAFRQVARRQLLARLSERRPASVWDRFIASWSVGPDALSIKGLAKVLLVAVTLAVLLLGGGRAASASEKALPGDTLYPVKVAVEDVRLALAGGEDAFRLYLKFAGTRVAEMERLSAEERFDDVPVAASRFEHQVQGAVGVVTELDSHEGDRSGALADELDESLNAHRASLNRLLGTVPSSVRPVLERAIKETAHEGEEEGLDRSDEESQQPGDLEADEDSTGTDADEMEERGPTDIREDASEAEPEADGVPAIDREDSLRSVDGWDDGDREAGDIDPLGEVDDASGDEADDDTERAFESPGTVGSDPEHTEAEVRSGEETREDADTSPEDRASEDTDRGEDERSGSGDGTDDRAGNDSHADSDDRSDGNSDDKTRSDDDSPDEPDGDGGVDPDGPVHDSEGAPERDSDSEAKRG